MIPTDLRLNWWYLNFYYFGSKLILIELIPYFVMIWMNFQIWKRIQAIINNEQPNQPESNRGKFFFLHFYYLHGHPWQTVILRSPLTETVFIVYQFFVSHLLLQHGNSFLSRKILKACDFYYCYCQLYLKTHYVHNKNINLTQN